MPSTTFIRELGEELTETGLAYYKKDDQRFMYTNAAFRNIFEVSEQQLLDDPFVLQRLLSAEDLEFVHQQFYHQHKSGHFKNLEVRLQIPGGPSKHVTFETIMMEDTDMLLLFVKDTTNRTFREDYVIKLSAQKDTLLDMLTHNLSGPLFVSKDILNSLQKGFDDKQVPEVNRMISLVLENTEQCIDIVNDFLRNEHLESMRVLVSKTRFDVIEKVNMILEKMRELNQEKTLSLISASNHLVVHSDSVKFFQIIHNLLSNSVKYTPVGGEIRITVGENGSNFLVSVADSGIGISEEIQKMIFVGRVNGIAGLAGEKSSGLGLSIAKKLVEMMGGKIWFNSREGAGAEFHVSLPRE